MSSVSTQPFTQTYKPLNQRLKEQDYIAAPSHDASSDMKAAASAMDMMQEEIDQLEEKLRIRDSLDSFALRKWRELYPSAPAHNDILAFTKYLLSKLGHESL